MSHESTILDEMNHGGLPFAYWALDEAVLTAGAKDLMLCAKGTDNGGSYVNSPTLNAQPGPIDGELGGWPLFNGSSQYTNVGTLGNLGSLLGNGLSIEAWAAAPTGGTPYAILGGGVSGGMAVYFVLNANSSMSGVSGRVVLYVRDTDGHRRGVYTTNSVFLANVVTHFAASFNAATQAVAIYVNGESIADLTAGYAETADNFSNFSLAMLLGARNNNGAVQSYLSGYVGRVAIYNYVLAADRVKAHYLAGLNETLDLRTLLAA